jgi:hypothetical protein
LTEYNNVALQKIPLIADQSRRNGVDKTLKLSVKSADQRVPQVLRNQTGKCRAWQRKYNLEGIFTNNTAQGK